MNLSFFIARRYLVKQKGTFSSFIIKLAIVATALSVSVMILALAVVTGFKFAITEKLYSFNGHVHIVPFNETGASFLTYNRPVYYDPALVASMRKVDHVQAVSPFAERPVIVQGLGHIEGLVLKGVNKDYRFLNADYHHRQADRLFRHNILAPGDALANHCQQAGY